MTSPGLVLAVLVVLIGAQLTRVLRPGSAPYLVTLGLAAAGFIGAEVTVLATHHTGLALGPLHPLADIVGIGLCEAGGILLSGSPDSGARTTP